MAAPALPPFPRLGITLRGILAFIDSSGCGAADVAEAAAADAKAAAAAAAGGDSNGGDDDGAAAPAAAAAGLSTADVSARFIFPATAAARVSYCDMLAAAGSPDVGAATVFVSHTWSYRFADVVATLAAWSAARPPGDAGDVFFWFDIFSNSQHNTSARPFAWWTEVFRRAVGDIGHTLLVMDYRTLRPTRRAWCVWEMACSVTERARLDVAMLPADAAELRARGGFMQSVAVSVGDAEAFLESDRAAIFAAIEGTIGARETGRLVSVAVMEWMGREMRALLAELSSGARADSPLLLRAAETVACEAGARHKDAAAPDAAARAVVARDAAALFEEALAARARDEGAAGAGAVAILRKMLVFLRHSPAHVEAAARRLVAARPEALPDVAARLAAALVEGAGEGGEEARGAEAVGLLEAHAERLERAHAQRWGARAAGVGAGDDAGASGNAGDDADDDDAGARDASERRLDGALVSLAALLARRGARGAAAAARARRPAAAAARAAAAPRHAHALVAGRGVEDWRGVRGAPDACAACGARGVAAPFMRACEACAAHAECELCAGGGAGEAGIEG